MMTLAGSPLLLLLLSLLLLLLLPLTLLLTLMARDLCRVVGEGRTGAGTRRRAVQGQRRSGGDRQANVWRSQVRD